MKRILFTLMVVFSSALLYANDKQLDFVSGAKYLNEQIKIWVPIIIILIVILVIFVRPIKRWLSDWFDRF
ncbi:MAG: hypothetical protein COC06_07480 [Bacteroidales bacterium]|nr:MAG: hypothetical protein COC06_07480 [Bacteroidales bacterium]